MSEYEEPDVVLVDVGVGDGIKQLLLPASLWAKVTSEAEETGTTVDAVVEQAFVVYIFDGIVSNCVSATSIDKSG